MFCNKLCGMSNPCSDAAGLAPVFMLSPLSITELISESPAADSESVQSVNSAMFSHSVVSITSE